MVERGGYAFAFITVRRMRAVVTGLVRMVRL